MSGSSKRLGDGRDDISCLNYLIIKIDAGKKLSTFQSCRLLSSFLLNSSLRFYENQSLALSIVNYTRREEISDVKPRYIQDSKNGRYSAMKLPSLRAFIDRRNNIRIRTYGRVRGICKQFQ